MTAISMVLASNLTPYERNARTHSDAQVAQLAASIMEFGFTNPVLADGGGIVSGHGRVLAALALYANGAVLRSPNGAELPAGCVPVLDVSGWSDAQRRAYILADNKLALNADWDKALLGSELGALSELGVDLGVTGFDADELLAILGPRGLTDADDAPEAPADPVSRAGDLWALGRHRLICGSSTDRADVERLLDGAKPHLMVTDPPYGVEYDPNWRNQAARTSAGMGNRALGAGAVGKVLNDDRADWREAWALFPGAVAYVWHGALHNAAVAESLAASGFQIRAQIVWVKSRAVISRGHYHWQHEPAFYAVQDGADDSWRYESEHEGAAYAVRKGEAARWIGGRRQTTVWEIAAPARNETGHGTQKPVECMLRPMLNNSRPGDAVYEPFSGSGTSIIAAEQSGRSCFAVELNPAYVDVAVRRWEAFTGQAARLDDGRSFADVSAERRGSASA